MIITDDNASRSNFLQDLALMKIYTVYRVILCLALLMTFYLSPDSKPLIGAIKPQQFFYAVGVYLIFNVINIFAVFPKKTPFKNRHLFFDFLFDIFAVIIIADASGGIDSGLGLLLIVIIASSSILLRRQLAMLTAAIATIGILLDTTLLINSGYLTTTSFLPAGILGITFFFTALLILNLANRIRGSQMLAEQRALDVSKLLKLNQSIVQRMRTGILVVNQEGEVQLANSAAGELLANPTLSNANHTEAPIVLSPAIMRTFKQWQQSTFFYTPPFKATETGPELLVSFSALADDDDDAGTLIFLEDNRRLTQKAQQIKLASLGRLTASIAHEIRNPLGAASHASQLLAESETINEDDKRLCEIVKKQSDRMNKVIENILQLSSRKPPNAERIRLDQWLGQFINEYENTDFNDVKIALNCQEEHQVTIDTSQLNQVITNLVQNGLRYSAQKTGNATLEFHIHRNSDTGLTILDIIDDGPGVAEEDKNSLFEPFYTTETKGTGLGLYISRELCETNETRLDYFLTENGKSCFRINFPHPDRRLLPE